jgi:DNA transformation protein and related proteins
MSVSPSFRDMIEDALAPLGPVRVKRMFGGAGVYCGAVMFGLVSDDVLHLKADATTEADFKAEGMGPFVYHGKGKPIALPYWRAPERLLDDTDELLAWARKALTIAERARRVRRVQ